MCAGIVTIFSSTATEIRPKVQRVNSSIKELLEFEILKIIHITELLFKVVLVLKFNEIMGKSKANYLNM